MRQSLEDFVPSNGLRSRPTLSVVIPARNEARNVGAVLDRLPTRVDEVVLVDGNSEDDTIGAARAARPDIRVVRQARQGKGNALAAGFGAATGDYIVMIDADGSMDPAEIPLYVAALDWGAAYVKGSRFAMGGGSTDISRLRRYGNDALRRMANVLFKARFTDLCYGFVGFRRECLDWLALPPAEEPGGRRWGDGFEIETILNTRAAKAGALIHEVPSFEQERLSGDSNLRTFRDGSRVLGAILHERFLRTTRRATAGVSSPAGRPSLREPDPAPLRLTIARRPGELRVPAPARSPERYRR
jgi:glycosyltransferase involved in cell wall biosynthesis